MKLVNRYDKEEQRLVDEALRKIDEYGEKDGTFEQAYHCLQNASDKMDDNRFMFEAGRRSAKLAIKRSLYAKAKKAMLKALDEVLK